MPSATEASRPPVAYDTAREPPAERWWTSPALLGGVLLLNLAFFACLIFQMREFARAEGHAADAAQRRTDAETAAADAMSKRSALTSEIQSLTATADDLRQRVADLKAKDDARRKSIEDEARAAAHATALAQQIDQSQATLDGLEKSCKTALDRLNSSNTEAQATQTALSDLQRKKSSLEAELAGFSAKKQLQDELDASAQKARTAASRAVEESKDAESRRDAARAELTSLQTKLADIRGTTATSEAALGVLSAKIAELKPQRDALEKEIAALGERRAMLETARARQVDLTAQVDLLTQRLNSLQGSVDSLGKQRDDLVKSVASGEESLAAQRRKAAAYDAAVGAVGALQQQEQDLNRRIESASGRIKALEDQEAELRRKIAEEQERKDPPKKEEPPK